VSGDWRKPHNEELHNLYSSPNIIRMIKSRRIRREWHVAQMGKPEGKRPLGRPICRWVENVLNWILERQSGMVWTGSIWLRTGTSGGLVLHGNEPSGPVKCWEVLE
jgi:hypothetical protein